jgi:hypothetical protein
MSSPKRAAKTLSKTPSKTASKAVAKTVAKIAVRRTAAARPGKPVVAIGNGASADAKRVAAALDGILADGNLDAISVEALQGLIASARNSRRCRRTRYPRPTSW